MSRSNMVKTQQFCTLIEFCEFQMFVALDTRIRRAACQICINKIVYNIVLKIIRKIEYMEINA